MCSVCALLRNVGVAAWGGYVRTGVCVYGCGCALPVHYKMCWCGCMGWVCAYGCLCVRVWLCSVYTLLKYVINLQLSIFLIGFCWDL